MVIGALDRKLIRNLGTMRGQVLTIALVVAAGIATYVTLRGTWNSLLESRDAYYDRYRFADVFAHARRAPSTVGAELESLPGVARVYTRITEVVSIPFDDEPTPATGQIVSIPSDGSPPPLNGVVVQSGRWPEPGRSDEILLLDNFAKARHLEPGDTLDVILNGSRRTLSVVGTALSPEYVFAMDPTSLFPEPDGFAVIWMLDDAVAAGFQMDGAFNDVSLRIQPDADPQAVIEAVDLVLEPYGGFGAVDREHQSSNYFLIQELTQLESMATVLPFIFLAVAAFLLNVVLSRIIHLQRSQIAALKALGYAGHEIGIHYLKLVVVVVLLGAAIGVLSGFYLGRAFVEMYTQWFHFPVLRYELDPQIGVVGILVSLVSAIIGASLAVRQVIKLPPAEAMRPPPPARYRRSILERLGVMALFGVSARMIFREITRRPLRTLMSSVGIGMAMGIMVAGMFGMDAFDTLMETTFERSMREDMSVGFVDAMPHRVVRELAHLPGVTHAEGIRVVPVRFEHGPRHRDATITGQPQTMVLRRLLDMDGNEVAVPREGLLLNQKLAEILEVGIGDEVTVRLREGDRAVRQVPVVALIDDMFGLQGYMQIDSLNRLLREDRMVSSTLLRYDPAYEAEIQRRLRDRRGVASQGLRRTIIERMRAQTGSTYYAMIFISTLFAATIAVGVVYNNARVALSMRSRDLASLRVLGFTRAEISAILMGELAVQVLLAIPIGMVVGTLMAEGIMAGADPEMYRLPVVISSRTYAFATAVTILSGVVSGLLVRRKLDQLDLIGVLKTRD